MSFDRLLGNLDTIRAGRILSSWPVTRLEPAVWMMPLSTPRFSQVKVTDAFSSFATFTQTFWRPIRDHCGRELR
jgi:hypothetical protein